MNPQTTTRRKSACTLHQAQRPIRHLPHRLHGLPAERVAGAALIMIRADIARHEHGLVSAYPGRLCGSADRDVRHKRPRESKKF